MCEEAILVPANNVWLDARPGGAQAIMGVIKLGALLLAASPAGGEGGSRHRIHEHQPEGEG